MSLGNDPHLGPDMTTNLDAMGDDHVLTEAPGRWIEYQVLADVVPALRNPRTHELAMLRQSFDRFGFTVPPLRDERTGRLVAGHGRMQLLQIDEAAALEPPDGVLVNEDGHWCVPVQRGWASKDDTEADAYLVADNRLTEIAGWDEGALLEGLQRQQGGPGLAGIGYDTEDIDDLYAKLQERMAATKTEPPPNMRHAQVKSLVLDYPLDQYGYVAKTAQRARAHYGEASNAELFIAMLREFAEAT